MNKEPTNEPVSTDTPAASSETRDVDNPDTPPAGAKASASSKRIIDNPYLILGMLFGVTAALGLPFLWVSRGFSTTMKVVWSIVVILYTLLLFWVFWLIMAWSISRIMNSM